MSILSASNSSASPIGSAFPPSDHYMADPLRCSPLAAKAGPEAGLVVGLVSSKTKVPDSPQSPSDRLILIDAQEARIKRLRTSVLTAARLHTQDRKAWKVAMLTLTYAPGSEWMPGQIGRLIRHIRKYLARKGHDFPFVWVQEFTKAGKPHYHVLVWLPRGITLPKPDKQGWWPYGMTKIEWTRHAVGYIAKYASKADSLHRPEPGARMYGVGGLRGTSLQEARWWKIPAYARKVSKPSDGMRRVIGGVVNTSTGEMLLTPWRVRFIGGKVYVYQVDDAELERCREIATRNARPE